MQVLRSVKRLLSDPSGRFGRLFKTGGPVWFWLAPPFVQRSRSRVYVASRPDSDFVHHEHPELSDLADSWVHHNPKNSFDLPRLYALAFNIKQVMAEDVPGDFAELGVFRGNSAAVLAHYARRQGRRVVLFDTFEGFDAKDLVGIDGNKGQGFVETSLGTVQSVVGDPSAIYVRGWFPGSVTPEVEDRRYAIAHLDCDLYEPMIAGLRFFYPRLSPGGLLIIHDYGGVHWDGAKRAVDEFIAGISERLVQIPDKSGTAMIRKAAERGVP